MTQSSFPCHRAWLVSSGTNFVQCSPHNLAPSTSTPWPYAFCLLSQPCLALFPLTLTLALSHDPKSFPVRLRTSPHLHYDPGSTFQGMSVDATMKRAHTQLSAHQAQNWVHKIEQKCGQWMNMPPLGEVVWWANFVESAPHLLVLGYSVLLVVLVPPQVLSIFSYLPFLNLLIIKNQTKDDSFKANP